MTRRGSRLLSPVLMLLLLVAAGAAAQTIPTSGVFLGPPPEFPKHLDQLHLREPPRAPLVLSVDPSSRETSQSFFLTYYENAAQPDMSWTGDVDTCAAGTTAEAFKDAVMLRINYFRAMAGVPAGMTWSSTYSAKDQQAALMMAANSSLNHDPPSTWKCYSAEGHEGAGNSNLALGAYGWAATDLYIKDPGVGNEAAGHRRWLLYPQTQTMGTGDIPHDALYSANALWVFDANIWGPRPTTREPYVAWPPPGYVPYQVVYPRWSFAYPDGNFTQASATVTRGGQNVPVTAQPYLAHYGENTLVWIVNNMDSWSTWPQPSNDEVYEVTIQNVKINGSPQTFNYTVTVYDPHQQACQYAVEPLTANFPAAGGTGTIAVTATTGCAWTANPNQTWIQITSGGTGNGNGTIHYQVLPSSSLTARSGAITVADKTVTIDQEARSRGSSTWLPLLLDN